MLSIDVMYQNLFRYFIRLLCCWLCNTGNGIFHSLVKIKLAKMGSVDQVGVFNLCFLQT